MLYGIIACAAIMISLIALIYKLEGQGRKTEQNEQMKQVLDDIHTANMARDRLMRDPAGAERVRERFTR